MFSLIKQLSNCGTFARWASSGHRSGGKRDHKSEITNPRGAFSYPGRETLRETINSSEGDLLPYPFQILDVLCSLCVCNGVAVRTNQNLICDHLLPKRDLLLQSQLVNVVQR